MKTIDYYIIKKFLGTFFYAISLLIIIVIIFDISENIDEFLENKAPLKEIVFTYYLNFIPYFINLFIYLFTFISVIFFTSKLASNTEIIAILNSGISFTRLLRPYLISAAFLAILSFYLSNFLIPVANENRREFKGKYMEKLEENKDKNIHMQIMPNEFVYVENFNLHTNYGYRFTLEKFDNEGLMTYKISSEKLKWNEDEQSWKLSNYFIRTIDGMDETLTRGKELDTVLALRPGDLYVMKEDFEVMNYWELNERIELERMKGSETLKTYQVEKGKRLASPFATIVMTIIAVSLSSRKIRGGIGMHLGLGLAIAFSFILFMQVSTVFAKFGNLSPVYAAWIPILIFSLVGIVLIKSAPK